MGEEIIVEKIPDLRVSGMGILINKVDELIHKQDRTNQLLAFIEKKLESLNSSLNDKV